ncbi:MAG: 16S rRNA (cytosine(1402)-N(4))-methyltransferase RsmH [Flavobacteriales bacterium]|nr:16S rRNA (cytosine(1402)-N(4))-methyltransferase RsmH [Flavobacteriales bacterium]
MYHDPVLLHESIAGLNIREGGTYVDATFGGGGHSKAILQQLKGGRLIAFDQDDDAARNKLNDERLIYVPQNFRYLSKYLKLHKALPVDGILADLGVSSHQFDTPGRGFSLRFDGPLDMRMDQRSPRTAAQIIAEYSEDQLTSVFKQYGELPQARKFARTIVLQREIASLTTTVELREVLSKHIPRGKEHSILARVFQALRMEVNDETSVLKDFIEQSREVIREGGRLAIISYHSLEDRLVKHYMRSGNWTGHADTDLKGHILSPFIPSPRKAIQPSEDEINRNPRARSARLRIAERSAYP